MANVALLLATSANQVFPTLQKKTPKMHAIACGEWCVPLLWVAIFRPEDMVEWRWPGTDGPSFPLRAPIVPRSKIKARLKESTAILENTLKQIRTWRSHVTLLEEAISTCDRSLKYVTIEWHEIVSLDPKRVSDQLAFLLAFFAGQPTRMAATRVARIGNLKMSRKFPDPATVDIDEFSEADWENLGSLLGVELDDDLPWTPQVRSKATLRRVNEVEQQSKLSDLIREGKHAQVKVMLDAGISLPDDAVVSASRGNLTTLRLVLECVGNIKHYSEFGDSAVLKAFWSKRDVAGKVRPLLDAGADVHLPVKKRPGYDVMIEERHRYQILWECCKPHGRSFATEILSKLNDKTLARFLNWSHKKAFETWVKRERLQVDELLKAAR